jgi:hypothetical protein
MPTHDSPGVDAEQQPGGYGLGQRGAEGDPLLGTRTHELDGPLGDADGSRAVVDPARPSRAWAMAKPSPQRRSGLRPARHAGTARRHVAAELITNLERIYQRSKAAKGLDQPRGTTWSDSVIGTGSGPVTHIAVADESFRCVRID